MLALCVRRSATFIKFSKLVNLRKFQSNDNNIKYFFCPKGMPLKIEKDVTIIVDLCCEITILFDKNSND